MNTRMHMHLQSLRTNPLIGPRRSWSANAWIGTALFNSMPLTAIALSLVFEISAHAINQCPIEARAHKRDGWRTWEAFAQELLRWQDSTGYDYEAFSN